MNYRTKLVLVGIFVLVPVSLTTPNLQASFDKQPNGCGESCGDFEAGFDKWTGPFMMDCRAQKYHTWSSGSWQEGCVDPGVSSNYCEATLVGTVEVHNEEWECKGKDHVKKSDQVTHHENFN